jgi:hypothetical protein
VIGFDKDWEMFRRSRGLSSVEYSRGRLVWDASCKPGSAAEKNYVAEMVKHKNDEWEYEAELREIFQLSGLKRSLEEGRTGYFLPIPPSVVLTVILGALCPIDTEIEVRSVLRHGHFPNVRPLKRAKLHESQFAMNIEDAA